MNNTKEFNVVFSGEIAEGRDLSSVKIQFAKVFNASHEKVENLFSGKSVILKRALSSENAMKMQLRLLNLGAITHLVSTSPTQAPTATQTSLGQSRPNPGLSLSLEPIINKNQNQLAPGASPDKNASDENHKDQPGLLSRLAFSPQINLRAILTILLFLLAIIFMIVFSPYPDLTLRKGFLIGLLFLIISLRRMKH